MITVYKIAWIGFLICCAGVDGPQWKLSLILAGVFLLLGVASYAKLMLHLADQEIEDKPDIEGRCEPWESLGDAIQRWRRKR